MYAVIKTGGKQYRVHPGDLLVVEKLDGDVGAEVSFDQVMLVGAEDGGVTVGAPIVEGARVRATLVETRKGDKIKVFKKIRRQGYRRTKGHRQHETVLRITGLEGAGQSAKWDGEVDLTPRSVLRDRARGLAPRVKISRLNTSAAIAAEAMMVETAQPSPTESPDEVASLAPEVADASGLEAAPAKKPRTPRKPKTADDEAAPSVEPQSTRDEQA